MPKTTQQRDIEITVHIRLPGAARENDIVGRFTVPRRVFDAGEWTPEIQEWIDDEVWSRIDIWAEPNPEPRASSSSPNLGTL